MSTFCPKIIFEVAKIFILILFSNVRIFYVFLVKRLNIVSIDQKNKNI